MDGRTSAERQYDNINNEGGEGYNPYRAEREKREIEEDIAWGKTRAGRKDRIYRLLETKDCSIARECGTYNQVEIDSLRAELAAIEAEEDAEFLAAWPLDITIARRAAWNAKVKTGDIKDTRDLVRAENAQGWRMDQLKKAVKLHKL